jgi:UDPglucose 6-dehydrogenase
MKLTIVGVGYVGLVSGICFAEFGHEVICLDTDSSRVKKLSQGICPIYEPGLSELLRQNIQAKKICFTSEVKEAVSDSHAIFISVGTPSSRRGNGYADMGYVYEAARSIAPFMRNGTVVINKSTVPIGSAKQIRKIILETNPAVEFDIVSNPEFLREGEALTDFMNPDRIVIGVNSNRSKEMLQEIYAPLSLRNIPLVFTSLETAEMIKYAANAFLATKISFINEMANLCEAVGGDVQDLARGIGLDHRIGLEFLKAGPGFGGSCFPKDTLALIRMAQEHHVSCRITEAALEVNNAQKAIMIKKIREALGGSEAKKTLAVLGLTFKQGTDDMREAPSQTILSGLMDRGFIIKAHDPVGMQEAKKDLPEVTYCETAYEACIDADGVCLMTDWSEYKNLDWQQIKGSMKNWVVIDLRNFFDPEVIRNAGFKYVGVGKNNG